MFLLRSHRNEAASVRLEITIFHRERLEGNNNKTNKRRGLLCVDERNQKKRGGQNEKRVARFLKRAGREEKTAG